MIFVVEYKGTHIAYNRDSEEKDRIGRLWAARSQGRSCFVMVKNKDWNAIKEAAKEALENKTNDLRNK